MPIKTITLLLSDLDIDSFFDADNVLHEEMYKPIEVRCNPDSLEEFSWAMGMSSRQFNNIDKSSLTIAGYPIKGDDSINTNHIVLIGMDEILLDNYSGVFDDE